MVCFLFATLAHPFSLQLFVYDLEMGYQGIGTAASVTNGFTFLMILIVSYMDTGVRPALHWPDVRCLYGHWEQLKLGGPIIINAFLEWIFFQTTTFTAGFMGIYE